MKNELSDSGLKYIYIPARAKKAEKAPVLLMLHGVGSNEQDLAAFAESLDPRFAVISLRAPLILGANSFAWFHVNFTEQGPDHNRVEAESSRQILKKFVEDIKRVPDLDAEKIFVMGFSQGTIMGLSLAFTEPELFKGLIAIGGRTLQEISAQAQGRRYDKKPEILLIHGLQDNKLPFFHAEATNKTLQNANFNVDFETYQAGHEITVEMRDDIRKWLDSKI